MGNVNIYIDIKELLETHEALTKSLSEHIFPKDHIVSVDEFLEKLVEFSKTQTYHITIIKF